MVSVVDILSTSKLSKLLITTLTKSLLSAISCNVLFDPCHVAPVVMPLTRPFRSNSYVVESSLVKTTVLPVRFAEVVKVIFE